MHQVVARSNCAGPAKLTLLPSLRTFTPLSIITQFLSFIHFMHNFPQHVIVQNIAPLREETRAEQKKGVQFLCYNINVIF